MIRHKLLLAIVLGTSIGGVSRTLPAQQPDAGTQPAPRPAIAKLRQLMESVRSKLRAITPERVVAARERLRAAVGRLDTYLARNGENGTNWRTYLALDTLQEAVAPDADAVDPRVFGLFQNRFNAKHKGLEERPFAEVAGALREYRQVLLVSNVAPNDEELAKQLEPLVKLTNLTGPASLDDWYTASQALGLLEVTEAAPELVTAVREEFSQPNLLFEAGESFVSTGISKVIDQWSVDNSCKKKTSTHSHTHTVGSVSTEFQPSAANGVLRSMMQGTAYTNATTHAGPAIVYANATTALNGSIALVIDEYGVKAKCATACADTSICFSGFGSTKCGIVGRIVTKAASRRAPKQRAQNEQEANVKAAQKLAQSLDEQAEDQVAKLNQKYLDNVRLPLVRYNAFPQQVRVSTTSDRLYLTLKNDERFSLAATNAPPAAVAGNDLTVRLHESFVNNMLTSVFAGRKVTEEEMTEFFDRFMSEEAKQERDAKRRSDDESNPWAITFADSKPITLEIDGNLLTLTIRGSRFESGNSRINNAKIIVRYQVSVVDGKIIGKRDADLYVIPLDSQIGDRVGATTVAQMGPLRRRLEGESGPSTEPVFKREFTVEPVKFKDNFAKLGTLHVRQFVADDGWLAVGWLADRNQPLPDAKASPRPSNDPPKPDVAQAAAQDNSSGDE